MNILIITPLFPPQNAVGALRPYTWAKYWGRQGHSVDVFTVESYGVNSGLPTDIPNVNVKELPVPVLSKMASKWQARANKTSSKNSMENVKPKKSLLSFLKNQYRKFIDTTGCIMGVRYPDMRDFWAKKICRQIDPQKYDLVISTGCPYSVHRVGYYVKKKNPKCFWILDWRDLWTLNPYWNGLFIFRWYERLLEKKYHKAADVITVVSDGLKEQLEKITTKKIVSIPNGFDPEDYKSFDNLPKNYSKKLQFVYIGTVYKGIQDITPFLRAVKELLTEGKISPDQIEFIAAGNVSDLLSDVNEFGVNEIFTYLGVIPRSEALKYIYNCDCALMLLGKNNKGILTGKLFEYLSLADSICGVDFSNESDAGRIINESLSGECFDSDVEKIKLFILQKLQEKHNKVQVEKNLSVIECFNRKKLAQDMLNLVEQK